MRKIEQKMCNAITANYNWRLDNTEVQHENGVTHVMLFNNVIARISDGVITLWNRGYLTPTTKSRLNAILQAFCAGYVFQRDFNWYYQNSLEGRTAPFEDGMVIPITD